MDSIKAESEYIREYIGDEESKFKIFAESSLQKMHDVASSVEAKLARKVDCTDKSLLEGQRKASHFVVSDLNILREKPIVAKCVIYYEKERKVEEFYVCRGVPPTGIKNVISYRHPKGRLAALNIGKYDLDEELGLRTDREIDITKIQGAEFKPHKEDGLWDSIDTQYRDYFCDKDSIKTISGSLRKCLRQEEVEEEDILSSQLAASEYEVQIIDGRKREIIDSMSLREQPILDSIQDEIFRMPLSSILFLQGPAGSGKTTTLIRRLGQKLDVENGLSEEEKNQVDNIQGSLVEDYRNSWIMFTPTTLLKDYLREAFNREGIPAPDSNISTWENYWTVLGREVLGILRKSGSTRGFEHNSEMANILNAKESTDIYSDFIKYLLTSYANEVNDALKGMLKCGFGEQDDIVLTLKKNISLHLCSPVHIEEFLFSLYKIKENSTSIYKDVAGSLAKKIDKQLNIILARDKNFLDSFYEIKRRLSRDTFQDNEDSDDIYDVDIDKDSKRKKAQMEYRNLIISIAKYKKTGKISAQNKELYSMVSDKVPSDDVLEDIFILSNKINSFKIFYNPIEKFFRKISVYYNKYRKERQIEHRFYSQDSGLKRRLDSAELDILILTHLVIARKLLSFREIKYNLSDGWLATVKSIFLCYKAQVYVDEAPDFSLVQLLCMRLLTLPEITSFFACGDFNQRITDCGINSIDEFNRFISEEKISGGSIAQKEVLAPYRQTETLYKFSLAVLKSIHGQLPGNYCERSQIAGDIPPVLGKEMDGDILAHWLADRIKEIDSFLSRLPSIAVLVHDEDDVAPVAKKLKAELQPCNIPVQACHEGQTQGNINAVRVFDIRHIKGLEFEAAFFVSLDKLEDKYPNLVGNYLYVGATRAATFLGVTYAIKVPRILSEELQTHFQPSWDDLEPHDI